MASLHIIMPVKDSLATAREAIRCIYASDYQDFVFTLYNDFSTPENTAELRQLSQTYGFTLHNWQDHTDHPSPNYRLTLQDAQAKALAEQADLLIIESDVLIAPDTISRILAAKQNHETTNKQNDSLAGLIAAVTHDQEGRVNFPYDYAKTWQGQPSTKKRFSFCCTLLTCEVLEAMPFDELNPEKDWYDVTISHHSIELGFENILLMDAPVLHLPHSSRPWKKLKYTNPIKYYLRKIFLRKDKI